VPLQDLALYLDSATISSEIFQLRPDYRCLLIAVTGIEPSAGDEFSEEILIRAEESAKIALAMRPVDELPHIAAWREAFIAFGAKPQRTRNSAEALIRRAEKGLPRINRLTDIYNAFSVIHQIPIGGEDLSKYQGSAKLLRAKGTETFETYSEGQLLVETPDVGEVVWCDDAGVTCRRWNWRQGPRTQLTDQSTSALFIFDLLDPITNEQIKGFETEFCEILSRLGSDVNLASRFISEVD
jgi:DNA/RNA-binding domain of Phe-tRNA-synthetase-like protein